MIEALRADGTDISKLLAETGVDQEKFVSWWFKLMIELKYAREMQLWFLISQALFVFPADGTPDSKVESRLDDGFWAGSAGELMAELKKRFCDDVLPKNVSVMARSLRILAQLAPAKFQFDLFSGKRVWTIMC